MPPLLSTLQRVLVVPELLDTIFRFLDDKSNVSNARVCRKWSGIALDILWRDVYRLSRLFGILAPLRPSGYEYEFDQLPDPADWARFERYRHRVRRLVYDSSVDLPLHQSVFDDIARTRTHLDLFPNLHTLDWNAALPLSVMFMHSHIKRFHVRLPQILAKTSPRPFFLDVMTRMPNLRHLDLRTFVPMRCIEEHVVSLISGLGHLHKFVVPRYTLTARVIEALSKLEHLEVVEFQYYSEQGCGDVQDMKDFDPLLTDAAFPVLWDLSITLTCQNASRFFELAFAPANLTSLYVDSHLIETVADVSNFFTILADNCQLLRTLALIAAVDVTTAPMQPPEKDSCININTLSPLFQCPKLISFEITHHFPLDLSQEDIEKISLEWPSIETLLLNDEPAYIDHPNLDLQALLPLAENCPHLQHLGLFINGSANTDLPRPSPTSSPSKTGKKATPFPHFRNLKRLSLGASMICDPGPIALFLSHICPLNIHLDSGITWESEKIVQVLASEVWARCVRWTKVAELLPLLIQLRMEERNRAKALQEEVQDLRVQTAIMKDREIVGKADDSCIIL